MRMVSANPFRVGILGVIPKQSKKESRSRPLSRGRVRNMKVTYEEKREM